MESLAMRAVHNHAVLISWVVFGLIMLVVLAFLDQTGT